MHSPPKLLRRDTIAAILLTLTAGYVDAIGFLKLGGIYVANMSGNSVAIGIHSAEQDWTVVLFRIWPLACFVFGLFCTRLFIDLAAPALSKRIAAPALLVETAFLLLFARSNSVNFGILFAATAMGIHAATLNRFNGVTIYTTFVTGTLVKFAESLSESLLCFFKGSGPTQEFETAMWLLSVWLAYVAGAITGAFLFHVVGVRAAIIACAPLVAVAVVDLKHPLSGNR